MKKTILATVLGLTLASTSYASVNADESQFLFGTETAVEMQILDNTEMQQTEGQFFGMMMAPMTSMASSMMSPFSSMAGSMMSPMISQMAGGATSGAVNGLLGQLAPLVQGLFSGADGASLGSILGAGAAKLIKSAFTSFLSSLFKK